MDFVSWCSHVLHTLAVEVSKSADVRTYGIQNAQLWQLIFGEEIASAPEFWASNRHKAVNQALDGLEQVGLVETDQFLTKLTQLGRRHAEDLIPIWNAICEIPLEQAQIELLYAINNISVQSEPEYLWIEDVTGEQLQSHLGTDATWLEPLGRELKELGLATARFYMGNHMEFQASYTGLVWQTRRGFTLESRRIDELVKEGETTSIEFKRELSLDTADQKAEFIKDMIGLANTQSSGRRLLIIGFDDKKLSYFGTPDPRVTQDRLEQIIADYIAPFLDVRYTRIDYRLGLLGQIEVLRDPKKLPHGVAKSIGDKKRILDGQIFVRHGSQTEPPTPAELDAIREEAARGNVNP